ncbi:MAG: hypothetical protein ACOVQY_03835, partial [Erythrobacter sp.]
PRGVDDRHRFGKAGLAQIDAGALLGAGHHRPSVIRRWVVTPLPVAKAAAVTRDSVGMACAPDGLTLST